MNQEYEQEINLKDLFFYILYRWRPILLTAIAFGILACGYKLASNIIQSNAEGANGKPKAVREYELKLTEYELIKTKYARDMEDYQKRLEQQEAYITESVLMQTDPYNVPTASADIFVKLNGAEWKDLPANTTLDPTDSLINVYTSNFCSTIDWSPVEELTEKDALYLKELVGVAADYNSNTFTIWVRHSNGDTAQQILEIIVNQVMARYQNMDADISRHSISVVNRALTYTIDDSLADAQKEHVDAVASSERVIIDCQLSLEKLEKPIPPAGLKKYIVLGFAAGGFLAVAFYGAAYIFGGRIHEKNELKNRYGYHLLGIVPCPPKKVFLSCIDMLIHKMDGTGRQLSETEAFQLIAAGMQNFGGKYKKILITGTADFEKLQKFAERVTSLLDGMSITTAGDLNFMPDTIKELVQCDAILLVEEQHVSLIEYIKQEQAYIAAIEKPVVGYVLL